MVFSGAKLIFLYKIKSFQRTLRSLRKLWKNSPKFERKNMKIQFPDPEKLFSETVSTNQNQKTLTKHQCIWVSTLFVKTIENHLDASYKQQNFDKAAIWRNKFKVASVNFKNQDKESISRSLKGWKKSFSLDLKFLRFSITWVQYKKLSSTLN